ncbi:hypothetical protein SGRIM128S_07617 [Streptomyces griseomycini]
MFTLQDDPFPGEFPLQHGVEEVLPAGRLLVRRHLAQHQGGAGGGEGVGVDLPVRVLEGDTDLGAPVLEAEHLFHGGQMRQLGRPVRPGLQDQPRLPFAQVGEGGVVVGGEADDLAPARVPGQRGEPVLEDDHVVRGVRDLAQAVARGGAQGALVGRRVIGAALPVRGDGDAVTQERVAADLGGGDGGVQRAAVDRVAHDVVTQVVVDDLATVGQPGRGLLHAGRSIRAAHRGTAHTASHSSNRTQHTKTQPIRANTHHDQTENTTKTVHPLNAEA